MAFIDKLNGFLGIATEKSGQILELTKYRAKIVTDKAAITELKGKIATYYYNQYKSGIALDEEVMDLCKKIDLKYQDIEQTEHEITRYKATIGNSTVSESDYNDIPDYTKNNL